MVSSEVVPDQSPPNVRERVDEVRLELVRLASLTLDAVRSGTEALVVGDHALEDECLRIIASPGLGAADLRFVGVALRIAHELERSADLMVNVARTTWRLHPDRLDRVAAPLVDRMSRQVIVQLRVAVNAFVDRDPSWAAALADMDDTTDELERRLFRHVLEVEGGAQIDEARLNTAVQLSLVARHYERIGDHAVTIAEQVHFVATGEHARASRFRR